MRGAGWSILIGGMLLGGLASCRPAPQAMMTTEVAITRPTVIAYFIVPSGAVDTSRDLAVEADDWNIAMATLRDSLEAGGITFAMTTLPNVHLRIAGTRDRTLMLGTPGTAGYVFVGPDRGPCVRPGGADADWVKATARAFAASKDAGCGGRP